jgi:hypothetical protein
MKTLRFRLFDIVDGKPYFVCQCQDTELKNFEHTLRHCSRGTFRVVVQTHTAIGSYADDVTIIAVYEFRNTSEAVTNVMHDLKTLSKNRTSDTYQPVY